MRFINLHHNRMTDKKVVQNEKNVQLFLLLRSVKGVGDL